MFKNRSFQVKMVKDAEEISTIPTVLDSFDFDTIDKVVKEYAKKAAIGVVLIYAAVKAIDTASEVTINLSKPR